MAERLFRFGKRAGFELSRVQSYRQEPGPKPRGLWVSVGMSWKEWCESESWNVDGVRYAAEVELFPSAKILWVSGAAQIEAFARTYRITVLEQSRLLGYYIDWVAVAERYQGIVISPYCWEKRLADGMMWYYGWDCASGCIWDLSAVSMVGNAERVTDQTFQGDARRRKIQAEEL